MTTRQEFTWYDTDAASLSNLHRDFILTYIDKVPTNFIIVCKQFYLKTLSNEYGLPTYKPTTISRQHIIAAHLSQATILGKITPTNPLNRLPYAYMTVKVHKTPLEFRQIAGSSKCSLEPISTLLNSLLQTLKPKLSQLWIKRLGINKTNKPEIWMLKSSLEITHKLNNMSWRRSRWLN